MNTYFLCIDETCDDNVALFNLEEYLKNANNEVLINVLISHDKLILTLSKIIFITSFLNRGIINEIRLLNEFQVLNEDCFIDIYELNSNTIFMYKLGKDTVLNVYSKVIILDDFEGTMYLKNSKAMIIAKRLSHAKVVTLKNAKTNITRNFSIIKGDDIL